MINLPSWIQPPYKQILNEVRSNRLSHALMVHGDQGVGVELLAEAIAKYRLCDQPADMACGQCKTCLLVSAGTHPDFKILEPTGAAQIVKVDQIREVVQFLSQTPQVSAWKVLWITEAHRMNINASNALLKVLEEPPGNSLILLATDKPQIILPTVRSRCRNLLVANPTETEAREFCKANAVTDDQLASLLPLLGLRPLKVCSWVSEGTYTNWELLSQGLDQFQNHKINTVALTDKLKNLELLSILEWLMQMAAQKCREAPGHSSTGGWMRLYEWLANAYRDVESGSNPNRQLMLDECFMRWKAAFDTGITAQA